MDEWIQYMKKADFPAIADHFKIDPVIARIMRNRDLVEIKEMDRYLNGTLRDLHSPLLMKGMKEAVSCIRTAIAQNEKIRVIGDYDIDGVCSTYILTQGLSGLGASVDAAIPHRIRDGYGLNESLITEAHEAGIQMILTCDNGIAAAGPIALAKELGMQVVVTDHHEVPFELNEDGTKKQLLPPADVVVDPKQADCAYPFPEICGAVVAWKLVTALYEATDAASRLPEEFLQFAAIATVGDVMELKDENRLIVKYGLRAISYTQNPGLRALIELNELKNKELSAYHIGFVIGPCINATGRLDTAERALKLFQTTDRAEAVQIARELKEMNDSRKDLTKKGTSTAIEQIEHSELKKDKVLILYLPECHESLAGIIAGRIREKYCKPTFVLTDGEEGLKGSGRSIEAYSMYEEMSRHKELFTKFGGHKLAAGLSLPAENLERFRREMNADCNLTEQDFKNKCYFDMEMPLSYITEDLIDQFSLLEPYGNGNPKPDFAIRGMHFCSAKIIGKQQNVLKLQLMDDAGSRYPAIFFGDIQNFTRYVTEQFGEAEFDRLMQGRENKIVMKILYYPEINEFGGKKEIQIIVQSYRA